MSAKTKYVYFCFRDATGKGDMLYHLYFVIIFEPIPIFPREFYQDMMRKIFLWYIYCFLLSTICQGNEVDSLRRLLPSSEGSQRAEVLNRLCWQLRNTDVKQAVGYGLEAIEYARKIGDLRNLCIAYSYTGVALRNSGNYAEAFTHYELGLALAEEIEDKEQVSYANINLGNLYIYQEQYEPALRHLNKAEPLAKMLQNMPMQAYIHLNLGRAYLGLMRFEDAEEHFWISYNLRGQLGAKKDQMILLKYIGDTKFAHQQPDSALFYYEQVVASPEARADANIVGSAANQSALVYLQKGMFSQAKTLAQESLALGQRVGSKLRMKEAYITLSHIAELEQNYQQQAHFQKQVIRYTDSLFNTQLTEKIAAVEFSAQQQQQAAQIQIQELELRRQRIFGNSLIAILLLAALLIFFLVYSNKKRLAANRLLQEKSLQIETQNEELQQYTYEIAYQRDALQSLNESLSYEQSQIEASITYAKRIQKAMLPSEQAMKDYFEDCFVLDQPRDVVSGDFYFFLATSTHTFIAVADCTGHGVPGALMSMIGINLLRQYSKEKQITSPARLLEKLDEGISEVLKQTETGNHDGMDIAICVRPNEQPYMYFAGANRPLNYIENGELKEILPTRNGVGGALKKHKKIFEEHRVMLTQETCCYLYSDGYQDQFGGAENRKFMRKNLKEMLKKIHKFPFEAQKKHLQTTLQAWQQEGNIPQTDDVLVVGFKL